MMLSTTGVIRVAVVDDQPLLVSAFSALVAAQPDMEVVLEAVDGRQAVEGLTARATGHHGAVDLVLMDLRMPVLDGSVPFVNCVPHRPPPPCGSWS